MNKLNVVIEFLNDLDVWNWNVTDGRITEHSERYIRPAENKKFNPRKAREIQSRVAKNLKIM